MSAVAIVFLTLAIVILWGGLIASILYLRARPDRADYPQGGEDDERPANAIIERDT
ncbi:methionine/alanine import family NSS transporter small subunit [Microbacterium lushaniae]|uniref:Methionine/alanine import family NSS transporter small subunit n=1 Tax=Microbacterium lushaniae TaxID=2614639 RepID=A0A5J6L3H9_9MICO|nr:methionine/alanine import family NSS transporter small subunit [Microbacterium lushaniae]QEW02882.1 methionine/alanine import family NSS transporter small subunit [Microbacterium lushaniae]